MLIIMLSHFSVLIFAHLLKRGFFPGGLVENEANAEVLQRATLLRLDLKLSIYKSLAPINSHSSNFMK